MNVGQIFKYALLELDEDLSDISDYDEKFRMYLNDGYHQIVSLYYKPKESYTCFADENCCVDLYGYDIDHVVEMRDECGRVVTYEAYADGSGKYRVSARKRNVEVVCQVNYPRLEKDMDTPRIPENVHIALVYFICYKHLSSGNLAKQSRAQYYRQSFYETMNTLKPVGTGSVTTYTNFYSATN